ncbi:hypothetical protein [Pseudoxanthomonas sp. Root65]|uniref:hypothetical protein n=1 Tax=Pseudoxanthomonas sp. Root65 TaxID=1736576 RepID=UPI000A3EFC9C|nr:hypothetical protein [Pseudoxanthomonas sp. Root65]
MNMDEAIDRIHALDRWVCLYPRSNTFAQFHADYAAQDPELEAFLNATEHEDCPQDLSDALNSLGESIDMGQFLESQDKPWRRISHGPSYSRDTTMDELYAQLPADYQVSEAITEVFEPIKARLHSKEWVGKPRREQLDWLDDELQSLISRIQNPESAAVVHAYLFEFIDRYDVEGADLDVRIEATPPPCLG